MLLQTNSYVVPRDKRAEHQRVLRRFRQTLKRLGCEHFEVYEQVGPNWSASEGGGRYVQILRFADRKHQLGVQQAERTDPTAQAVIAEFCDLINFPYQQQQGLFAVGFYTSVLPIAPKRTAAGELISTVEHEVIDDEPADAAEKVVTLPAVGHGAAESVAVPPAVPQRQMIDSVRIDSPTTAAGELFDVLEADAPVHNLEGTPPQTEPVARRQAAPADDEVAEESSNGFEVSDEPDDERANGFVLEDAADGRTDRQRW